MKLNSNCTEGMYALFDMLSMQYGILLQLATTTSKCIA